MAKHDTFLLRIDPVILKAVKQWAADELRSANGQIEFLLREALQRSGRLSAPRTADGNGASGNGSEQGETIEPESVGSEAGESNEEV